MEKDAVISFSLESILQVLKKYNFDLKKAEKEKNLEKITLLKEEVIPKYDRLYFGLKHTDFSNKSREEISNLKDTIKDILKKNKFSNNFIKNCQEKRKNLKGISGAEVTKNLFLYTVKDLEKKRGDIFDKLNPLLKKETQLENDLKECIQYDDEMKVSFDIVELREKKRTLNLKLEEIDFLIKQISYDLDCGWKYEIFGTISKEELKNSLK